MTLQGEGRKGKIEPVKPLRAIIMTKLYTPEFIKFGMTCKQKLGHLATTNDLQPISKADAKSLLEDFNKCTIEQSHVVMSFARNAKIALDKKIADLKSVTTKQQKAINSYNNFFLELEKMISKKSREQASEQAQENTKTAYKPAAPAGQSFYDSIMHVIGYDATTVGASAMFFLAFSALRFMLGTPYWEQAAEYTAAEPSRKFDAEKITEEQAELLLHKDSSREEILQAGFIPKPNLANALEVEFKTFAQKMGAISKQATESKQDQAGFNLINKARS